MQGGMALVLVSDKGLAFYRNKMETSFPSYLLSSFLCVFSSSMFNVPLAKEAAVGDTTATGI